MEHSANLQLPYIMPSQAQKHVTHNEAIRALDALVQLAVLDRDLSAPPGSPADGARYLVPAGGSDAWSGKDGMVAAWQDGAWAFIPPKAGWLLWVADESRLLGFDGAAWVDAAVHSVNPTPLIGANANADSTNRLVVKSPASLFDEETGDHRLKINKATADDTASLIFQSGYLGRAEFGLAGDDDWHVKVSADGAAWTEALKVDRATGRVSLPAALPLGDENQVVTQRHVRELLTADRTYYVRSDGSDSNTGLSDTSGGAFLTIAKAISSALALDPSIYNVAIVLQNGTWGGVTMSTPMIGNKTIAIQGSGSANVALSSSVCVNASGVGVSLTLTGLTLNGTTNCINAASGATVNIGSDIVFAGNSSSAHIRTNGPGSSVQINANYSVTSGGARHLMASPGGYINAFARTVTLAGTLNFSSAFADCDRGGLISTNASTFSGGTVTGKRYNAATNGVIFTGSAGASHFPGNSTGTTATGGQYA